MNTLIFIFSERSLLILISQIILFVTVKFILLPPDYFKFFL